MPIEHAYFGSEGPPLVAHDRMLVDRTPEAKAVLEKLKESRKGRKAAKRFAWPETAVFDLEDGGDRRVHDLPAGVHIPCAEIAPGVTIRGCDAHSALDGCKETAESSRPRTLAPQFVLARFALAAAPVTSPPESNDGRAEPEVSDSTVGPPTSVAPDSSAASASSPDDTLDTLTPDMSQPADREALDITEAIDMASSWNVDEVLAELLGETPNASNPVTSTGKVLPFTKSAGTGKQNPKLEAALDLAVMGFRIFPLVPNAKTPAVKDWQQVATTDPERIKKCWIEDPSRNIGVLTEPFIVIDVDPRNGGNETFAALEKAHDFPPTRISKTRSEGQHRIYALPAGTRVKGGTNLLGPGVDVKSWGGYIVAPGSSIDGRFYTWANDLPVALAPPWLIDKCKAAKPHNENAGKRLVPEDDTAVELARKWMERQPAAESGTIDDTEYKMAARCGDFGCGVDTIEELLTEWCMKHDIPTSQERLREIASSGLRNRENAIGARHPSASGFEAVEIVERPKPANQNNATSAEMRGGLATPLRRFDPATLPPVPWVIPGLAARQMISTLIGPGGVSKSTWILHLAVASATGRDEICGFPIRKRQRVWVWSQEDTLQLMELRLAAIMQAFGVTHDDLHDDHGQPMIYLNSGVGKDKRLKLVTRDRDLVKAGEHLGRTIASAKEIGADLVILDPLISFHDSNENDNMQIRKVVDFIGDIAADADCAVELVIHTSKPEKGSSTGFAGNQHAARGASALIDAVRVATTFVSMSEEDKKKHWLIPAGASHLDYVRIDDAKMNIGKKRREPRWFKREDVKLRGFVGDSIEVLRPVELEAKEQGRPDALTGFARAMAETEQLNKVDFKTLIDRVHELTVEDKKKLNDRRSRKRWLDEAFGDVAEYPTDYGKLIRDASHGTATTFTLKPWGTKKDSTQSDDDAPAT